ncbi:hypothetical protein GMDG_00273 [Pseudogymnoascus destructans 20631-21]|uniref:Uncharacterized protein n=2 Tax=Pseudogymnoascus destructans TaxID=655981 RepID=L8G3Z3_PSED2|nr:hypothetical protein GMDG_00273 [Pseudogymnoascus destructans 20631-21]
MSASNTTASERERQYRPTYNSLPKSRSSVNFGAPFLPPIQTTIPKSESSVNFGAPFLPPIQTVIPKSESSVNFGAPFPPSTKTAVRRKRNRSLVPFERNEIDLHGTPTVATSSLTASASQVFMHPNRVLTPTKIPSPTRASMAGGQRQCINHPTVDSGHSDFDSRRKQTSKGKAPVRNQYAVEGEKLTRALPPSQKKDREKTPKVNHQTKPKYRAPTPGPSVQQGPPLTRARTLQVLTSITSSFSLTNLHKATSNLSLRGHTGNTARSSSGPAAFFSRVTRPSTPTHPSHDPAINLRDVRTGMPQAYWAGRYRTLDDKFHSEDFDIDYLESPAILEALREIEKQGGSFEDDDMSNADQLRYRRVFAVLETHCKTPDAKKSLWSFQQAYARNLKSEHLLPVGGSIQEKENIFSRAGKFFSRSRSVSVLSDKRFMKNKKAEAKMYRKKAMERSLLNQKKLSNQYDEVMEALKNEELWEAGGVV